MSEPIQIMELRGTFKGGGGPDKTILMSAAMHDDNRVKIYICYLRDPHDHEFQITARAKELKLDYEELIDRSLIDVRCVYELAKIIKRHKIKLIHAHDDKSLLYAWFIKLFNPAIKIVFTCHLLLEFQRSDFPSLSSYINYLVRKKISIFLTKKFEKPIMAVSGFCKKQLLNEGLEADDVVVLHNGIDIQTWKPDNGHAALRQELNIKDDNILIGTVARIDQQKDFPTFIKVVKRVVEAQPNVVFVIVGDGKDDELEKLKKQVHNNEVDNHVYLTGHRNDLLEVYSSFDIFLMTSNNEGLPNTVLESMAMELPVVSTIVAGVPELVTDGVNGFLCPIGDVLALAKRVEEITVNQELRCRLGVEGRKRIEQDFSFIDRVRKLEDIYEAY